MDREDSEMLDRMRGALIGLAVGDAVGTTLEFQARGTFEPISDMVGGGPFDLKPGEWTDDTSMALCLAESLIEQRGFDPVDQLRRYVRWWREGHMSCTGACFDIGNQTETALEEFVRTGAPHCGPTGEWSAGNGSLMRLAPVAIAYIDAPAELVRFAGESSRTTHGARACIDACRVFGAMLCTAMRGETLEWILDPEMLRCAGPLCDEIARVVDGTHVGKAREQVRGSGYVVHSLEAALWAFATTKSFESAVLTAANLGEDADTTAAICGQIAGAFYGESEIPAHWRARLARGDLIEHLVTPLCALRLG